jgi:hypothetical protein
MARDLKPTTLRPERGTASVAIVSETAHFMGDILGAENYHHSD